MRYEMLVGVSVTDRRVYEEYRSEIRPLLEAAGAAFRFDCEVSRVLKGEDAVSEVNRLFVLGFPSRAAKEAFFGDPAYREIRARLFEKSVQKMVVLAEYSQPEAEQRDGVS